MDSMKRQLNALISSVDGLHAIVISDQDGVSLTRVADDSSVDMVLGPQQLSAYAMTLDQMKKIDQLGKSKYTVCFYNNFQLVIIDQSPILVTMIADADANSGSLIALQEDLAELITYAKSLVEHVGVSNA